MNKDPLEENMSLKAQAYLLRDFYFLIQEVLTPNGQDLDKTVN